MVTVVFGASLRDVTGVGETEVEPGSVRRIIAALDEQWPGLGDRLRDGTSVAIDGEILHDAELEQVPDGAELHFIAVIGGG